MASAAPSPSGDSPNGSARRAQSTDRNIGMEPDDIKLVFLAKQGRAEATDRLVRR